MALRTTTLVRKNKRPAQTSAIVGVINQARTIATTPACFVCIVWQAVHVNINCFQSSFVFECSSYHNTNNIYNDSKNVPPGKGLQFLVGAVQMIESGPAATIDIPIIAPTIEWVVETGNSRKVASMSHKPQANNAHTMPYINRSGL